MRYCNHKMSVVLRLSVHRLVSVINLLQTTSPKPLVGKISISFYFSESQAEVQGWLDEMEAEIKAQGAPGENLEQVKKQYDTLKVSMPYLYTVQ